MLRLTILTATLLGTFVPTAHALYFFENTRFRYSAQQSRPTYQYTYPTSYPRTGNSGRVCLYTNASGECMVEQYIDTSNYSRNRYRYPVYDRNYLRYERDYADRDDDYYEDDDDYYYDNDDDDDEDIDDDEWEDIKDDFFDDDDSDYDDDDDDDDD